MNYLRIMFLSMVPVTELRGAIPIGIALDLNPIGVYMSSVIGSTLVAIPLVLAYRHIVKYLRDKRIFVGLLNRVDNKIETSMKKMKAASFLGIILFVGIPLPTTGTWTAAASASPSANPLQSRPHGNSKGQNPPHCPTGGQSAQRYSPGPCPAPHR